MDKMKMGIAFSFLLVVSLLSYFFFWKKNESNTETSDSGGTQLPPPPPPLTTIPINNQNGATISQPLDPEFGEAKVAIDAQIKNILRNSNEVSDIVFDSGLFNDLFKGVSSPAKNYLRASMLSNSGVSSPSSLPLDLERSNAYEEQLQGLIMTCSDSQAKANADYQGYLRELQQASNFSDSTGLNILPVDFDTLKSEFIDNAYNNGNKCGSNSCKIGQRVKLASDLTAIANNLLKIQSNFDEYVKEKAVKRLQAAGWSFIGYI